MNEMNNGENNFNNQNFGQPNMNQNNVVEPVQQQHVQPTEPPKKEEKKSYCGLLIVFMVISLLLAGYIVYDKAIKKEEIKEPEKQEEIKEPEKNVNDGIIVYGNGKIIESDVIKNYVGTYEKYDADSNVVTGGITISKELSECKIEDNKDDKIIAIRIYLFDYNASDAHYYPIENSILEFVRKSSDGSNYSTVFVARLTANNYELDNLDDDGDYYYI